MNIKPVIINIDDNRLYAQVAFLVDRPDFLKDIQKIRQDCKIDPKMQNEDYFKTASDDELLQLKQRADIYKVAANVRQKYNYPPYFDDIIVQTIMFHKVHSIRQTKVVTHLAKAITTPTSKSDLLDNHLEMTIHITPATTKEEVIEAFAVSKKLRSKYEDQHPLTKILDKKTLRNLKRDRLWYWRVQKDRGYQKLINELNNRPDVHIYKEFHKSTQRCDMCYIDDDNYLHHVVFEYRKLLNDSLPEV